ncbi:hypothetical protein MMC28_006662 [Mycoblastus sanguinarius]|nr:hypothetical protein [Mycoblastus sanguinarius]
MHVLSTSLLTALLLSSVYSRPSRLPDDDIPQTLSIRQESSNDLVFCETPQEPRHNFSSATLQAAVSQGVASLNSGATGRFPQRFRVDLLAANSVVQWAPNCGLNSAYQMYFTPLAYPGFNALGSGNFEAPTSSDIVLFYYSADPYGSTFSGYCAVMTNSEAFQAEGGNDDAVADFHQCNEYPAQR